METTVDPLPTSLLSFRFSFVVGFVLVCSIAPLRADKVFLRNGQFVEGTITSQDRTSVRMNVAGTNQVIGKAEIVRILFDDPAAAGRQAEEEKRRTAEEERRKTEERIRQERKADEERRSRDEKLREEHAREQARRSEEEQRARLLQEEKKRAQRARIEAERSNASEEDKALLGFLTEADVRGYTPSQYSGLILGASQLKGRYNSELEPKMVQERTASLLTITGSGVSYQEPWRNTGYRGGDFWIGWRDLTWYAELEVRRIQMTPGFFGYTSLTNNGPPVIQGLSIEQGRIVPLKRDQSIAVFGLRIARVPFVTRAYGIAGWSSFRVHGSYEHDASAELRIPAISLTGYQGGHIFDGRGDLQATGPVFGLDLRRALPFGMEIRAKALASTMSGRWKERSRALSSAGFLATRVDSMNQSIEDSKVSVSGVRSEVGVYYTLVEDLQVFFAWQHEKLEVSRTSVSKIKAGTDAADRDPQTVRFEYLLRMGGSSNRDLVQGFRLGIEAKINL